MCTLTSYRHVLHTLVVYMIYLEDMALHEKNECVHQLHMYTLQQYIIIYILKIWYCIKKMNVYINCTSQGVQHYINYIYLEDMVLHQKMNVYITCIFIGDNITLIIGNVSQRPSAMRVFAVTLDSFAQILTQDPSHVGFSNWFAARKILMN